MDGQRSMMVGKAERIDYMRSPWSLGIVHFGRGCICGRPGRAHGGHVFVVLPYTLHCLGQVRPQGDECPVCRSSASPVILEDSLV